MNRQKTQDITEKTQEVYPPITHVFAYRTGTFSKPRETPIIDEIKPVSKRRFRFIEYLFPGKDY